MEQLILKYSVSIHPEDNEKWLDLWYNPEHIPIGKSFSIEHLAQEEIIQYACNELEQEIISFLNK